MAVKVLMPPEFIMVRHRFPGTYGALVIRSCFFPHFLALYFEREYSESIAWKMYILLGATERLNIQQYCRSEWRPWFRNLILLLKVQKSTYLLRKWYSWK